MRLLVVVLLLILFLAPGVGRSQKSGLPPSKLSPALAQRLYYRVFTDSIDVVFAFKKKRSDTRKTMNFRVLQRYQNIIAVRIPVKKLVPVLQDSNTVFADLIKAPKEELTTGALDLAANKLNVSH